MSLGPRELHALARKAAVLEAVRVLRHDLRNVITSVSNASVYLRRRTLSGPVERPDPRVEAFFDLIDSELSRAEGMLSRDAFALPPPEMASCGVAEAVALAAQAARADDQATVEIEVPDALRVAMPLHDAAVLLLALIDNALDAAGPEGAVVVTAAADRGDLRLDVRDTGPGFGPEAHEPLYTTRPGRIGLGLSVVRTLAGAVGGRLVETTTEAGTVVTVTLPQFRVSLDGHRAGPSLSEAP